MINNDNLNTLLGLSQLPTSAYEFGGKAFTTQELWCKISEKINVIIEHFNLLDNKVTNINENVNLKLEYLLGEGLSIEVAKEILLRINDGTLGKLLNETLLAEINSKVESFKSELLLDYTDKFIQTNNTIDEIYHVVSTTQTDITTSIKNCLLQGDTKVPSGEFTISETIVIPPNTKLELSPKTILKPTGNFNVIELLNGSSIVGGTILVDITTHTKSCICVRGKNLILLQKGVLKISDITLIGNSNNTGILMQVEDKAVNNVSNECIGWVNTKNVNCSNFRTGIYLKASTSTVNNNPWINANNFENIGFELCTNDIILEGMTNAEISGNKFSNIQIQSYKEDNIVKCTNAKNNTFDMMIWDFDVYQPDKILFRFDETSNGNYISSNNIPKMYIDDKGYQNRFRNSEYVLSQKIINTTNNGVDFIQQSNGTAYQFWCERDGVYENIWDIGKEIELGKKLSNVPVGNPIKNGNGYNQITNGFHKVFGYIDVPMTNGDIKSVYTQLPKNIVSSNIVFMKSNIMSNITKNSQEGCQVLTTNCVKANDTHVYITVADISSKLSSWGGDNSTFRICYEIEYFTS